MDFGSLKLCDNLWHWFRLTFVVLSLMMSTHDNFLVGRLRLGSFLKPSGTSLHLF